MLASQSQTVPLRTAARMPAGMPMASAMSIAIRLSWIVTTSFWPISAPTGEPSFIDSPRSPVTAELSHAQYCWGKGSFRRYFSRMNSMTSVFRSSPASAMAASPGISF